MKIGDIVYTANTSITGIKINEFRIIEAATQKGSFIAVSTVNPDIRQFVRTASARHPTHHKTTKREAVEFLKNEVAKYIGDANRRLWEVEAETEELAAEQEQIGKWLAENP